MTHATPKFFMPKDLGRHVGLPLPIHPSTAAGGVKARIAVMTAATSLPGEVGDQYIRVFERIGAESIEIVNTERREDSEREDALRKVSEATGIFFTGGDQSRIVDLIKDTPLDEAIQQRHQAGAVIGGTSAGAAMMPGEMIVGGSSVSNPSVDAVEMGPGIGIDEDTGIIVEGNEFTVIGRGAVTVVDETSATHNRNRRRCRRPPCRAAVASAVYAQCRGGA